MTPEQKLMVQPDESEIGGSVRSAGARAELVAANVLQHLKQRLLDWVEPFDLGLVLSRPAIPGARRANLQIPDLAFFSASKLKNRLFRTTPPVPELVVAVAAAPSQRQALEAQLRRWLEVGAEVGLLVNSWARTVSVFRRGEVVTLDADKVLSLPDLLPGWEMELAAL